jgi:hypothetical protein
MNTSTSRVSHRLPAALHNRMRRVSLGVREKRRQLLPAHVVIRYVIAMGLYYEESYEDTSRHRQ